MTLVDPASIRPQQQPTLQLSSSEEERCAIYDMTVVSTQRLMVIDGKHDSVLLVDSHSGEEVARVNVPGKPYGVCMVRQDCAAVTIGGKKVQFIDVKHMKTDTLTLGTRINVGGNAFGIKALDNRLVVTFNDPSAVEVITMQGLTLHRIDKTSTGRKLFDKPWYVAVSSDNSRVFVSDWIVNTIIILDAQLQLIAAFSQVVLNSPGGIISLNEDQLLVSGQLPHAVILLQVSSGRMSAILGEEDGIDWPRAQAFCHDTNTLYIAAGTLTTSIQRYRLR